VAAEARIIGTTSLTTTEIVSFSLAGLRCINDDQVSKGGCSDYEIRFCCAGITNLVVGECTKQWRGQWSSWKDRDDPSVTGDWELLNLFTDDDLCLNPVAAEARVVGTTSLTTTEIVSFSLAGLRCVNDDQLFEEVCSDYEIRFCCAKFTNLVVGECRGQWSSWKDRDDPSLTGDWELLNLFTDDDLCLDPVAAEARIIGTTSLTTTEIVSFSLAGLRCINDDQVSKGGCSDYEIRFCCAGITNLVVGECTKQWRGQWSSWKDRDDPSVTGDWELLNLFTDDDLCLNPAAAEARIIGTTSLTTTEIVSFSLAGLICVNSDQVSEGRCSDYEIRFCCDEKPKFVEGPM